MVPGMFSSSQLPTLGFQALPDLGLLGGRQMTYLKLCMVQDIGEGFFVIRTAGKVMPQDCEIPRIRLDGLPELFGDLRQGTFPFDEEGDEMFLMTHTLSQTQIDLIQRFRALLFGLE
jgi:hypothetical protein